MAQQGRLCVIAKRKQTESDTQEYILKERREAAALYDKLHYDRIELRVSKGRKVELQKHAFRRGESLNAFCNRAIDNQLLRDW